MQVLRKLLFPFSLIYGFVIYLRNFFYNVGILKSISYKVPLICIGNLSVGGTGKTPMTEFLISLLKDSYKVAVLSRGYKRKSKGFVLANNTTSVEEIGDEPFQYHQKFDNIHIAVDADRRNGIDRLQEIVNPDVILLDDAFQHRKVKAGLNILLTVYNDLYVNDLILPAGNLRDSKREAKRADIIVVTKCPQHISVVEKEIVIKKIQPKSNQKVFFTAINYDDKLQSINKNMSIEHLKDKKFMLVTGIAKPKPLVNYLKEKGFDFDHLNFPDHHNFNDTEIEAIRKSSNLIITTEKDFVRLNNKVDNLFYIKIKPSFLFDGINEFSACITNFLKRH